MLYVFDNHVVYFIFRARAACICYDALRAHVYIGTLVIIYRHDYRLTIMTDPFVEDDTRQSAACHDDTMIDYRHDSFANVPTPFISPPLIRPRSPRRP